MTIKYDKLKDLKTDENFFDFVCPNCGEDGMKKTIFEITPVGVSYRPYGIDNSDIKNNVCRIGYDSLLTKDEAIIKASSRKDGMGLLFNCKACKQNIQVFNKINPTDMNKWIKRNMEVPMELKHVKSRKRDLS